MSEQSAETIEYLNSGLIKRWKRIAAPIYSSDSCLFATIGASHHCYRSDNGARTHFRRTARGVTTFSVDRLPAPDRIDTALSYSGNDDSISAAAKAMRYRDEVCVDIKMRSARLVFHACRSDYVSSRHLLPGSSAQQALPFVDGWIPATPATRAGAGKHRDDNAGSIL